VNGLLSLDEKEENSRGTGTTKKQTE